MAGHGQCQPSADCFIGVRPTVFPEGQLRDVHVVDTETAVLAQRDPSGIEMGSGVVEVAEADLNVGPDHQQHVGEVRRDAAHRSRARRSASCQSPAGGQCLDVVGRQNGAVDRVRPDRVQSRLPKSRGLARTAEHRENVGQRDDRTSGPPAVPHCARQATGLDAGAPSPLRPRPGRRGQSQSFRALGPRRRGASTSRAWASAVFETSSDSAKRQLRISPLPRSANACAAPAEAGSSGDECDGALELRESGGCPPALVQVLGETTVHPRQRPPNPRP